MTTIPMEPGPVDAFMQAHPERGTLRIQVTAGPFPVAGRRWRCSACSASCGRCSTAA